MLIFNYLNHKFVDINFTQNQQSENYLNPNFQEIDFTLLFVVIGKGLHLFISFSLGKLLKISSLYFNKKPINHDENRVFNLVIINEE